ncbi:YybH family protein [Mycolicibacter arupensis]|uniref:SnoaL-like domain-containing protein n=1 Tax=Mycolicibacter arupensis TaxID=342002 RepID=A0A5B1MFH2_9MYCO|nr:nuclear transport factor 2 family protein [Mycolicibacter arupensis]KAA1430617.1 hypothetical protein F0402_12945 [Mycolicibacter arupensis]TXI50729.1 MAG: hypothetical protein E6Q54_21115 [Mycolicibacter arupensis]
MPDTDVLREVLNRWKAAIDAQDPEGVSAVFAEDALFQGLRRYSVGRQGVREYYASQAPGMTVDYQILHIRRLASNQVLGYLSADFGFPDRSPVNLFLGVIVEHTEDAGSITYYQASQIG